MKKMSLVVILAISVAVFGCAGMSDTQQRTLSGAAIGAGGGALVGAIGGDAALGAAVGAAAGAGGGYLYDRNQKSKEAAYNEGYKAGQQSSSKSQ